MLNELVFDAETGSQVRLGNAGSNVTCYMKHRSTRLWCLAYSLNGAQGPGTSTPEFERLLEETVQAEALVAEAQTAWLQWLAARIGNRPRPTL